MKAITTKGDNNRQPNRLLQIYAKKKKTLVLSCIMRNGHYNFHSYPTCLKHDTIATTTTITTTTTTTTTTATTTTTITTITSFTTTTLI